METGKATPLNGTNLLSHFVRVGLSATVCQFEAISSPISLPWGGASCCVAISRPSFDLQRPLRRLGSAPKTPGPCREALGAFAQEFCAGCPTAGEKLRTAVCLRCKVPSVSLPWGCTNKNLERAPPLLGHPQQHKNNNNNTLTSRCYLSSPLWFN